MSSLVPLFSQTVTLQGYQITSSADMQAALQYISGIAGAGYGGMLNCQNVGGTVTWSLLINNSINNTSQTALVNDWIILENNSIVDVCKAANFATLYHT